MVQAQRPDAIDTRWVFRIYATAACLGGVFLSGWGCIWLGSDLPGQPWGKAALIRVFGAIFTGVGCCAAGFAGVDDPRSRRRALLWSTAAHAWVWLTVLTQHIAIWDSRPTQIIVWCLFSLTVILLYLWATAEGERGRKLLIGLFDSDRPAESPRSQYEQQIREVARQEERNRLARDLHDSVKQQIFVVQTAAATVQARLDMDQAGTREALSQVRHSAREAMTEMEAMLDQLHAAPLENAGLVEALKRQAEALGFRTGARIEFRLGELPPNEMLPPGAHEAVLRVAQEAFSNIGRHARAANVQISLSSAGGRLELRIQDDGAGFDTNQEGRGQGLANMHARAEEFGGKFELASRPGRGTSVTFAIPFTQDGSAREYRQKAIIWAALLAVLIALFVRTNDVLQAGVAVVAAIGIVRNLVAWRRLRVSAEVAR